MRLFEILLIVFLLLNFINICFLKKKRLGLFFALLILPFFFFQIVMEGYRLQMLPSYLTAVIFFILEIFIFVGSRRNTDRKKQNSMGMIFSTGLLILSIVFPTLFPVSDLPVPTGPYKVGTTRFIFTDYSRPETFTDEKGDYREISTQVWYPADNLAGRSPVNYNDSLEYGNLMAKTFIPIGMGHVAYFGTNSYVNIPCSDKEESFPVILFSHGYVGNVFQNTIQMEELASFGYIVFSVGHAYEASAVFSYDNKLVPSNRSYVDDFFLEVHQDLSLLNENKISEYIDTVLAKQKLSYESVNIWAEDLIFLTDQIEVLNYQKDNEILSGKLDMNRLGVFGHSFGGATASQVCLLDKRFKAGINMDGVPFGDAGKSIFSQPFLVMCSTTFGDAIAAAYNSDKKGLHTISISNSSHYNYTDFSVLIPKKVSFGLLGKIDSAIMTKITNTSVLSFFDKYIKGDESVDFKAVVSIYPQVTYTFR